MEQIFLRVLDLSIMASWIVLAVLVLRLLLHKAPRWSVCLLWIVVALRLVCPFTFESDVSLVPPSVTAQQTMTAVEDWLPEPDEPVSKPISEPVEPSQTENPPTAVEPAPSPDEKPVMSLAFTASIVWIVGVFAMAAYSVGSYVRLRCRLRTATRVNNTVFQSEYADTAFILGVVRPRVYLPYGMSAFEQPYVLAHEQAHLRRGDHIIKLAATVLLAVYWFNPLLWVAYVVLCRDLELACDERVIRDYTPQERQAYSAALLANSTARRLPLCPLAFGEVGVKQRIKSVMQYKKPAFWLIVVAVIAAIATAVCLLTSPREKKPVETTTMTAVVMEVNDGQLLVDPLDMEDTHFRFITVVLPTDTKQQFTPGDTVEFAYDELETDPPMIKTVSSLVKTKAASKPENLLTFYATEPIELMKATADNSSAYPIYYYGFDKVEVEIDGKRVELAQAIVDGKLDVTAWLKDLCAAYEDVEAELYDDGGSALYRFPHFNVFKEYQVISDNLVDGSNGEYVEESLTIGLRDMDINEMYRLRDELLGNHSTTGTTAVASVTVRMTVTELISDTMVAASPVAGSSLEQSSNLFHISLKNLQGDKPQVGDIIDISYAGGIQETYPAQFDTVLWVKVADATQTDTVKELMYVKRRTPTSAMLVSSLSGGGVYDFPGGLKDSDMEKLQVGSVLEVEYSGNSDDSYPGSLSGVKSVRLVDSMAVAWVQVEELLGDKIALTSLLWGKCPGTSLQTQITVGLDKLEGNKPQVDDVLQVVYDGRLNMSDPAKFSGIQSLRVVNMSNEQNVQYPLTVTKTPTLTLKQLQCGTDYPVYLYGLDSVQVSVDGRWTDLAAALKNRSPSPEELLADADGSVIIRKDTYKDGGSVLYDFGYYRILKMHTIAGDNSLFIGTPDMTITAVKALPRETTTTTTTTTTVPADLLQMSFDDSEKHLVSDAAIAAITPYEIYYTGVSSVRVKVDGKYVDLLSAIQNKQVDLSELLSSLSGLAKQTGDGVVYGDGVDENGKPKTYQQRMLSTCSVYSYYSEDVKYVEFIAKKA